ncbi:MAG: hypothetical protein Q8R71_02040 [Phenylobacterium sp.]|nr:hypothetical protein [Phenylobacterium sp.]
MADNNDNLAVPSQFNTSDAPKGFHVLSDPFQKTDFSGMAPLISMDQRIRNLMGASIFRDPSVQIEEQETFEYFWKEFRGSTATQAILAKNASRMVVQLRRLHSTIETAVARRRAEAARGIVDSRFHAFYPPPAAAVEVSGLVETAYGSYMQSGGRALFELSDSDAIARAIALLAIEGLPESTLDEYARVLALPEIEKLERIIAAKNVQLEALINSMLRLLDRIKLNKSNDGN